MRAFIPVMTAGLCLVGLSGCMELGPIPHKLGPHRPDDNDDYNRGSRRERQPALDYGGSA